jgi:hypothetical protein|tara:strand:+ start:1592 stop:2074 length:483 start_codon:yes stop_codon:yes gene_type:complete
MNAWALLYDELNMSDLDWVSANGGFEYTPEVTGNVDIPDGYEMTADGFVWPVDVQEDLKPKNKSVYKYNEDKILQEVKDYVSDTYRAHYNSDNGTQTLDLIESVGDAAAFCRSNILKYASRYDKKGSARMDIKKIIHYAVLLYHFNGLDKEPTERGYETF